MKKRIVVFLVICLTILTLNLVSGCGDGGTADTGSTSSSGSQVSGSGK